MELRQVTNKLLELLSEGLGLEGKAIRSCLGDEIEFKMKINMYPPCPQPQLTLGVKPHADMSALTLLVPNDVPGLQVWKDGNWVAVNYLPNSLFVHVGDQVEVTMVFLLSKYQVCICFFLLIKKKILKINRSLLHGQSNYSLIYCICVHCLWTKKFLPGLVICISTSRTIHRQQTRVPVTQCQVKLF